MRPRTTPIDGFTQVPCRSLTAQEKRGETKIADCSQITFIKISCVLGLDSAGPMPHQIPISVVSLDT